MSAALQRHAHVHPTMAVVLNSICLVPADPHTLARNQAFFDKSLAHIRAQGRASETPADADRPLACKTWYRSPNGDTCTIGCHIADVYDPSVETVPAGSLMRERAYLAEALGWPSVDLAEAVQCAHDFILRRHGMAAFEREMADIAISFGLRFPALVVA